MVRDLRKSFRKRKGLFRPKVSEEWALDGVSFEVARGETYGLLGPNGSGKSTLIRILSTLLIADGGEVRLLGKRLPEEQDEVRRLIGRVSVDAAFYKKLSARENLLYTALLYGLKPEKAEKEAMEVLEQLGMEEKKFSAPLEEMSRGMQQKISLLNSAYTIYKAAIARHLLLQRLHLLHGTAEISEYPSDLIKQSNGLSPKCFTNKASVSIDKECSLVLVEIASSASSG